MDNYKSKPMVGHMIVPYHTQCSVAKYHTTYHTTDHITDYTTDVVSRKMS